MCYQKFSVVPNNSIYDSTSYFPVRPSHSANTYTFSKYIWLMYYFFLLYSISTRLAFVFVLKNYMKPNMILLLLSTLSCQVNTWVLNFVTKECIVKSGPKIIVHNNKSSLQPFPSLFQSEYIL